MHSRFLPMVLLGASFLLSSVNVSQAQFEISGGTGTFVPSFRDGTNTDLGNTTFYGWAAGGFDGGANDELIEGPTPTLGVGGVQGTLNQVGTADILAGSNNIYNGSNGRNETLTLSIATNGFVGGEGFTTIIIQGLTNSAAGYGDPSALLANQPIFGSINGVLPQFVIGLNSSNYGQWWVKYEVPGNASSYELSVTVNNVGGPTTPLTITQLEVDTQFSTIGYSPDVAVVPEPTAAVLLTLGSFGLMFLRRRR